jgi:hypothetical protein
MDVNSAPVWEQLMPDQVSVNVTRGKGVRDCGLCRLIANRLFFPIFDATRRFSANKQHHCLVYGQYVAQTPKV